MDSTQSSCKQSLELGNSAHRLSNDSPYPRVTRVGLGASMKGIWSLNVTTSNWINKFFIRPKNEWKRRSHLSRKCGQASPATLTRVEEILASVVALGQSLTDRRLPLRTMASVNEASSNGHRISPQRLAVPVKCGAARAGTDTRYGQHDERLFHDQILRDSIEKSENAISSGLVRGLLSQTFASGWGSGC